MHVGVPHLSELLLREHALMHPHVLREIALGSITKRQEVLTRFLMLRVPNIAQEGHLLDLIERYDLWSTGIGYSDAHVLASALLTPDGQLWSRDKRLHKQAVRLGVAYAN